MVTTEAKAINTKKDFFFQANCKILGNKTWRHIDKPVKIAII